MQAQELRYTSTDYTASVAAEEYIRRYLDADRFLGYCKECRNYGSIWACPPFIYDPLVRLRPFRNVFLIATRIEPEESYLPLACSRDLIRPERVRLESRLLELETQSGGLACAYTGECLHCPEGTCARRKREPCRHPELVRPSLEAYGFDISRTLTDLFGMELLWGNDGKLPKYLTLVCGLFHNCEKIDY